MAHGFGVAEGEVGADEWEAAGAGGEVAAAGVFEGIGRDVEVEAEEEGDWEVNECGEEELPRGQLGREGYDGHVACAGLENCEILRNEM